MARGQRKRLASPKRDFSVPKPLYDERAGYGVESAVHHLPGTRLVHKIFTPEWITVNYPMGGRLEWITRKAYSVTSPYRNVQPPKRPKGFFRLPPEEWEKITLLLANHSVDVFKTAKKLGIPVPRVFRAVCVKGKQGNYWVLEMNDIRKEDTVLVPQNEMRRFHKETPIANLQELERQIKEDKRKMSQAGFHEDDRHPFNAWEILVNTKTGKGERILVDATNLFWAQPKRRN